MEVGARGAQPAGPVHVLVERGEAFLAEPVDVVGAVESRLRPGVEPRLEQWVGGWTPLEDEWSGVTPPFVATCEAMLHALEVRQAV